MRKIEMSDSRSLDRPAWTSEQKTGMFNSYNHKHCIFKGDRQTVLENYYFNRKGIG